MLCLKNNFNHNYSYLAIIVTKVVFIYNMLWFNVLWILLNERLLIAETVKNRDIILNKYLQKYTLIQDRYFNEKSYVLGWLDIF